MKIKLQGSLFKHPMEYNHITIFKDMITIHNNDHNIGFIRVHDNPILIPEKVDFTLNKKDYALLGTLEEMYIEKKEGVVYVTGNHMKAKFADMLITPPEPNMDDLVTIGIGYDDLALGKSFVGVDDGARPQYGGVTILSDRIIASDSYCMFQKDANCEKEVNIPKEVFKYLKDDDYTIKTNGKLVLFETEKDGSFYSNVIETLLTTGKLDDNGDVSFQVNKNEILEKLKIIKEYSPKVCRLSAKGETLSLSDEAENNQITLFQDIVPLNLGSLLFTANTTQLIRMISIIKDDSVIIKFNKVMVKVVYDTIVTASCRIGNQVEVIPS